jgi:hypothetical protein
MLHLASEISIEVFFPWRAYMVVEAGISHATKWRIPTSLLVLLSGLPEELS